MIATCAHCYCKIFVTEGGGRYRYVQVGTPDTAILGSGSECPANDRGHEVWVPQAGDWVVYRPHPGARPEDGEVTEVVSDSMVRVRYAGDRTAKATYVRDLEPGVTDLRKEV